MPFQQRLATDANRIPTRRVELCCSRRVNPRACFKNRLTAGSASPQQARRMPAFRYSMETQDHDWRSHSRTGCGCRAGRHAALRRLVSGAEIVEDCRQAHGDSHAVGHSVGLGTHQRRPLFRHARYVSASWYSPFLRMVRWAASYLQIPRLVFRGGIRAMP